jgi:rhamnosyltransferase
MIAPLNLNSIKANKKLAAIIVVYLPSEKLLSRLINSIKDTINLIIIIDNTPNKQKTWLSEKWLQDKNFKLIYKSLGDNLGIGKAQNIGIAIAIEEGSDHVIFFDQDSEASAKMVSILLSEQDTLLLKGANVGSVGPAFIDEKTGMYSNIIRYGYLFKQRIPLNSKKIQPVRADILISSGQLIRTKVIQKIGPMREDLFIDGVDVEWTLRAAHYGYQHFVIPNATLIHNIGDSSATVGKRKVNLHSSIKRHYYSIRNHCNLVLDSKMGAKFRVSGFLMIPIYILFFSLNSNQPIKTFLIMLKGCRDGFLGKLGRGFNN